MNIESFFKKSNKLDGKERNCFHLSVGFQISNSPIYLIYTVDTKAAFIMYPTGGQRILGGALKFLEQKRGGYENCLNISWGDAYFL